MIIVKDQWASMLANFVRKFVMSSNSIKKLYYLCNDRQRQEKLASLILYTKHMLKSITLNDFSNSKVVALYNLYQTNELVVANMDTNKYNVFIKMCLLFQVLI